MFSIFSTQNLQTFLRRKYLRPPSRGPPGPPPGRGPREGGRWLCPSDAAGASGALVSSAMMLLHVRVERTLLSASFNLVYVARAPSPAALSPLNRSRRGLATLGRRCCGRRRCGNLLACIANRFDLVEALLFLVNAHADELEHRFGHAQPALEFVNQAARSLNCEQDVHSIVKAANGVSEPPLAHLLDVLHGPPRAENSRFQGRDQLIEIFFRHIRANDEHQFVSTIHSFSLQKSKSRPVPRRLPFCG